MRISVVDCETTTSNKGNPFDQTNVLCAVGVHLAVNDQRAFPIQHGDEPYGDHLTWLSNLLEHDTDLYIGFNIKFDLNWLYNYGVEYTGKVWDTQLFEHFASNCTWIYPDLETACAKRGVEGFKEKVIEDYWNQGINTTAIPWEHIEKRVLGDVDLTYKLYLKQVEVFNTWSKARQNLFSLQCQDLLVLHQIERNGFYYDEEKSKEQGKETQAVLLGLTDEVNQLLGLQTNKPNLNSDEHLSALLYGGTIKYESQKPIGVFKSGQKVGQTRYQWIEEAVVYPRLITPLEGTGGVKEGVWSVDKKVLGRILNTRVASTVRKLINLFLKYSAEARSLTSYLNGLPKLIAKMNWPKNMLHGSINQVVVVTGRTSSSKPNLQNFDGDLKSLFTTRFK